MIQGKSSTVGRQLEALWTSGSLTGISDAQLLSRFAAARDAASESAFRELVHRHGSMVMGVCRQILRHPHDADDAFQATFLVLVRKADSIRVAESLAPWLYAVAYRTARRARAVASRYRSTPVESLEDPMGHAASDSCHFDLRPLLHEELNRLPGKYRQPIVLCHLEGKTHEEAARLLHWRRYGQRPIIAWPGAAEVAPRTTGPGGSLGDLLRFLAERNPLCTCFIG
jgi:RNA polymerase sigma factor (sigma-70 family)